MAYTDPSECNLSHRLEGFVRAPTFGQPRNYIRRAK